MGQYITRKSNGIEFPRFGKPYGKEKIPGAFFSQDIEAVKEALEAIGLWQIEETQEGFTLYGHKT